MLMLISICICIFRLQSDQENSSTRMVKMKECEGVNDDRRGGVEAQGIR